METARFAQYVVAIIARCNVQGTARYRVKDTVRYRTLLRHQRALAQDFLPGCPDIRQIVHIGVPDDIGCYIQETGRAGRDGLLSVPTLLHSRVYHKVDEDIKMYAAN